MVMVIVRASCNNANKAFKNKDVYKRQSYIFLVLSSATITLITIAIVVYSSITKKSFGYKLSLIHILPVSIKPDSVESKPISFKLNSPVFLLSNFANLFHPSFAAPVENLVRCV